MGFVTQPHFIHENLKNNNNPIPFQCFRTRIPKPIKFKLTHRHRHRFCLNGMKHDNNLSSNVKRTLLYVLPGKDSWWNFEEEEVRVKVANSITVGRMWKLLVVDDDNDKFVMFIGFSSLIFAAVCLCLFVYFIVIGFLLVGIYVLLYFLIM